MLYKKAQVGETMTWVVATIIIIIILSFSIFIASINPGKDKDISRLLDKQSDLLAKKSLVAYLLTENIYNQLKEKENFDKNNGDLAQRIFKELYEKDYEGVWLGFIIDKIPEDNNYFEKEKVGSYWGGIKKEAYNYVLEDIQLKEGNELRLILTRK
ncbi:hypothetical protein CMI39_02665 [Candidatus Pacearchaeota archaeon]|jgi:hypothetical protein|nr:hypothetical protein [Candidatus Pacearchaeota archaeon]|tara:strand:+ start:714 stop:1181 length:468 start_codon:yes stop_codon:yes gene_type:complete